MLFAGCSNCRMVAPLGCGGQMMFHPPTPVEPSPMGPYCPYCGPMPPVFTCPRCGTIQGLYMQGMSAPSRMPGVGPLVAPVVQTQGSAPPSHGAFQRVALEVVTAAGKGVGQAAIAAWC